MRLRLFLLFGFLLLNCSIIHADPSVKSGQEKAIVCSACHGVDGISVNSKWPNIAGQHAGYLAKQMQDYKLSRLRSDPVMSAIVANLSTNDIEELALFYASMNLKSCSKSKANLDRGKTIYNSGDLKKHITACIACHGPDGSGNSQAGFPLLTGQNPEYTVAQLQFFKDKKRTNDLNSIMHDISTHMNFEDMQEVAEYICSLSK